MLKANIHPKYLKEILDGEKTAEVREIEGIKLECAEFMNLEDGEHCGWIDGRRKCKVGIKNSLSDNCQASFDVKGIYNLSPDMAINKLRETYPDVPWSKDPKCIVSIRLGDRQE